MGINQTLVVLLRFAKTNLNGELFTWKEVASTLEPVYGFKMPLEDVIIVLLREYGEAFNEKRFELGNPDMGSRRLILAPIKGHFAVEFMGPSKLDAKYSIEDFYNSMVRTIISELRQTRCDWCKEQIFGNTQVAA